MFTASLLFTTLFVEQASVLAKQGAFAQCATGSARFRTCYIECVGLT